MTEILHHLYLNWQMGIRVGDLGVTLFCSLTGSSGEACWLAVVRSGKWVATVVGEPFAKWFASSGGEGQQCAAGAGQGKMAYETKECMRVWGVGHCCYLSKGASEHLDLDLMASKCERTANCQ